jgi:rhodanese-related sulfurtransferase
MATLRLATSTLLRASRASVPRTGRQFRGLPKPTSQLFTTHCSQRKLYSTSPPAPSKIYFFPDIQKLSENPSATTVLIDAREPSELTTTGTIPTSINIPITSQPDSFFITAEEFEDRFGFERPGKDTEVVFYCKAGVRSRAAADLARQAGWQSIGEYAGSWLDWEKNGGVREGGREGGS